MPRNTKELITLPEPQMCAAQVYYLEQQIKDDLRLFPSENVKEVHYHNFDDTLVKDIGQWIGVRARRESKLPQFQKDSVADLSADETRELNGLVEAYPFSKELFV